MWFGIIIFGGANGFILLPVLLSYFGTLTARDCPMDHPSNYVNPMDDDHVEGGI